MTVDYSTNVQYYVDARKTRRSSTNFRHFHSAVCRFFFSLSVNFYCDRRGTFVGCKNHKTIRKVEEFLNSIGALRTRHENKKKIIIF